MGNFERSCALNGTLPPFGAAAAAPSDKKGKERRTFSPLNLERRREGMGFEAWSADLMTQIKF